MDKNHGVAPGTPFGGADEFADARPLPAARPQSLRARDPQGLTDEDIAFADEVLALCPGSFLGGSYVVKGRAAHDIDVVIPNHRWAELRKALSGRIVKVRTDIPTEAEDISDLPDDERLVTVYRRWNVDLLVIHDMYVPTYQEAVRQMTDSPDLYQDREERVALHVRLADAVREERGLPDEFTIIAERKARGKTGEYD
jgi:hypothetical protein